MDRAKAPQHTKDFSIRFTRRHLGVIFRRSTLRRVNFRISKSNAAMFSLALNPIFIRHTRIPDLQLFACEDFPSGHAIGI